MAGGASRWMVCRREHIPYSVDNGAVVWSSTDKPNTRNTAVGIIQRLQIALLLVTATTTAVAQPTIRITMDIFSRFGPLTNQIMIHSNDGAMAVRNVVLRATIIREISTGSSGFPIIWNGAVGKESRTSLQLANNSNEPVTFRVTGVSGSRGLEMHPNLPDELTLAPGEVFPLNLSVEPKETGQSRGTVVIGSTSKRTPEITLRVICIVRSPAGEEASAR